MDQPSVVVIGGGTGTYTVLSSLRDAALDITALLTMVDDGGSNRILRDEFGLLPTSGVRQAMVALSHNRSLLRELFLYRFHQGNGIAGMTFGNLFLAAVADIVGSQEEAIEETCKLLSVHGRVLPISYDDVRLVAQYADGTEVIGEHLIDEPVHDGALPIVQLWTTPQAHISPKAREAIRTADVILLGPGDFFTNTIANLVVDGVCAEIIQSKAKLIFIGNLMTKYGETIGYTASTFLSVLDKYIPLDRFTHVVLNTDHDYPADALKLYKQEQSVPIVDDLDAQTLPPGVKIVREAILSHTITATERGDALKRSMIRHDQKKLGQVLLSLIAE